MNPLSAFATRPLPQKFAAAALLLLAGCTLAILLYRSFDVRFEPLFGPFGPNETVRLIEKLEAEGAEYRIEIDGTVAVPRQDAAALRHSLGDTLDPNDRRDVAVRPHSWAELLQTRLAQYALFLLLLVVLGILTVVLRITYRELRQRIAGLDATDQPVACEGAEPAAPPLQRQRAEPEARMDVSDTAAALQEEHPQTVAVFLNAQPPAAAAVLLNALPRRKRGEVWVRMATSHPCDEKLVTQVTALVEAKSRQKAAQIRVHDHALRVYKRLSPGVRRELMQALHQSDSALYQAFLPQSVCIEDMLFLNRSEWEEVSRGFSFEELKAAFYDVAEALTETFFATMPSTYSEKDPPLSVQPDVVRDTLLTRAKSLAARGRLSLAVAKSEIE